MNAQSNESEFILTGLDGSNPLGLLATLGVLRAVDLQHPASAFLRWNSDRNPILTIRAETSIDRATLTHMLADAVTNTARTILSGQAYPSDIIRIDVTAFRHFAQIGRHQDESTANCRLRLALASAFGSDAITSDDDPPMIEPTRLSLANGNGHKTLLAHFRGMAIPTDVSPSPKSRKTSKIDASVNAPPTLVGLIGEAIFDGVLRIEDAKSYYTFRWDPAELRGGAHLAKSPNDTPMPSAPGANLLAVLGMSFFPAVPRSSGLATTGFFEVESREVFCWPLWHGQLSLDGAFSLLTLAGSNIREIGNAWNTDRGIFAVYGVERYKPPGQNNVYFNAPFSL
jgi:hypothetical protein